MSSYTIRFVAACAAVAAVALAGAQCTISDNRERTEKLKACLEHGGYIDGWTNVCKVPRR